MIAEPLDVAQAVADEATINVVRRRRGALLDQPATDPVARRLAAWCAEIDAAPMPDWP